MTEQRVIKKYPNRRLYDTEESRYITLADVRQLVLEKVDFVVIDKKSGQDITRAILLQVIAEQEQHGDAIMTEDFLAQVIRSYGRVMPGFMARYLEQSLRFFLDQQQSVRSQVKRVVGIDPVEAVTEAAQKNFNRWRALQDDVRSRLGGAAEKDRSESDATDSSKRRSRRP